MGTNYYIENRHIGKRICIGEDSCQFILAGDLLEGESVGDALKFLSTIDFEERTLISNEYGEHIPLPQFLGMIRNDILLVQEGEFV